MGKNKKIWLTAAILLFSLVVLISIDNKITKAEPGCCLDPDKFCQDISADCTNYDPLPCSAISDCTISGCCHYDCTEKQHMACSAAGFTPWTELLAPDYDCDSPNLELLGEQPWPCDRGCCIITNENEGIVSCSDIYTRNRCNTTHTGWGANFVAGRFGDSCNVDLCQAGTIPYGTINGIVYDDNGLTITDATKTVLVEGFTQTIASGYSSYSFSQILPGLGIVMTAYAPGYETNTTTIDLASGETKTVNFYLRTAGAGETGIVTGTVFDQNDNPIANAWIYWIEGGQTEFTDGYGSYTFPTVSQGMQSFEASASGYNTSGSSITVTTGINTLDFKIQETGVAPTGCGNNIKEGTEQCDGTDSSACPGACIPNDAPYGGAECSCASSCSEVGGSCAEYSFQCTGSGIGGSYINPGYSLCAADYAGCCNKSISSIPQCAATPSGTKIVDSQSYIASIAPTYTGDLCSCGANCGGLDSYAKNYCIFTSAYNSSHVIDSGYCCKDASNALYWSSGPCGGIGTLTGFVYNESSAGISGATVTLEGTSYSGVTSSSGEYTITLIAAGSYTAKASNGELYNTSAASVAITAGATTNQNFYLKKIDTTCLAGIPKPSLAASNVIGESTINLSWGQSCRDKVHLFMVKRNGTVIIAFPDDNFATGTSFNLADYLDKTTGWGKSYTYQIMVKSWDGFFNESNTVTVYTGSEECKGKYKGWEECRNSSLARGGKLVIRAECNNSNQITAVDDKSGVFIRYDLEDGIPDPESYCSDTTYHPSGSFCQESNNKTWCASTDICKDIGITGGTDYRNIFGLYYRGVYAYGGSSIECLHNLSASAPSSPENDPYGYYRYCYLDYYSDSFAPATIVDKCIPCSTSMFCYDYNSQEACTTDNCFSGKGYDCKWHSLSDYFSELGKGICYAEGYKGTDYCSECGSNAELFKNTHCTQDICSKLGACYANAEASSCKSCSDPTDPPQCEDFLDESTCTGNIPFAFDGEPQNSGVLCNSSTILRQSKDICSLGRCKWSDSYGCYKDGNHDYTTDFGYHADNIAPTTTLTKPNYIGYSGATLTFNVDDLAQPYSRTYYCISNGICCPTTEVILAGTRSIFLDHNSLGEMEGNYNVSFFSLDYNENAEAIKYEPIYIDTKPPRIINFLQYWRVNATDPLSSFVYINITLDEHAVCTDSLTGSTSSSPQLSLTSIYPTKILNYTGSGTGLLDGLYTYAITCSDDFGNSVTNTTVIRSDRIIEIFDEKPNATIGPYDFPVNLHIKTTNKYYCQLNDTDDQFKNFNQFTEPYGKGTAIGVENYYNYTKGMSDFITGSYNLFVRCFGDSGHTVLTDTSNLLFSVDQAAPITELFDISLAPKLFDSSIYYKNPRLELRCNDSNAAISYPPAFGCRQTKYCLISSEASCIPNTTVTAPYALSSSLFPSTKTICFSSTDSQNAETVDADNCVQVKIDSAAPSITISFPLNNYVTNDSNLQVSGRWNDSSNITITINWVGTAPCSGSVYLNKIPTDVKTYSQNITLCKGPDTITVWASDRLANVNSTLPITVYYDTIGPPMINSNFKIFNHLRQRIDSLANNAEYGYNITFNATINDTQWSGVITNASIRVICADCAYDRTFRMIYNGTDKYTYILKPGSIGEGIWDMPAGSYNVTYYAEDMFGNYNSTTQSFIVRDTMPPSLNITIITSAVNAATGLQKVSRNVPYNNVTVRLYSNEPISQPSVFKYKLNSNQNCWASPECNDYNGVVCGSGSNSTSWYYKLTVSSLSCFDNLEGNNSQFEVETHDSNNVAVGNSNIVSGRYFETDTKPPNAPQITPALTPFTIEGTIFATGFITDSYGYAPNNVINLTNNETKLTMGSSQKSEPKDNATIYYSSNAGATTITVLDNDGSKAANFSAGKYIQFSHNRRYYQRYSISSSSWGGASTQLTTITFSPALEQSVFANEIIKLYFEEVPTAWFGFNVSLTLGNNSIVIYAIDDVANIGQNITTLVISDYTPPRIYALYPPHNSVSNNNGTSVSALITDDNAFVNSNSVRMIFNNTMLNCSANLNCQVSGNTVNLTYQPSQKLVDAVYNTTIYANDTLGNRAELTWGFEIDHNVPNEPDITVIGGYKHEKWYTNDNTPIVNITFNKNEYSNITNISVVGNSTINVSCTRDANIEFENYTFRCSFSLPLSDKEYTLDISGNKRFETLEWSKNGRWYKSLVVDTAQPGLAIDNIPAVKTLTTTITGTYSEPNIDYIRVFGDVANNATATISSGTYSAAVQLNETNINAKTIKAEAYDKAGNVNIALKTLSYDYSIKIANESPSGYINKSAVTLYAETDRAAACKELWQNNTLASVQSGDIYKHNYTLTALTDGVYSIVLNCKPAITTQPDKNTTINFTVDTIKPFIKINYPPNNMLTNLTSLTLVGETEPDSRFTIYINGLPISDPLIAQPNGTFSKGIYLTRNGSNTITVEAKDSANNVNSTGVVVTLSTEGPGVLMVFPDEDILGSVNNVTAILKDRGAGLDMANSQIILIKNTSIIAGEKTIVSSDTIVYKTASLADGYYYLTVIPLDNLGREGAAYQTYFIVDSAKPSINLISPPPTQLVVTASSIYFKGNITSSYPITLADFYLNEAFQNLCEGVTSCDINNDGIINFNIQKNLVAANSYEIIAENQNGMSALNGILISDIQGPSSPTITVER